MMGVPPLVCVPLRADDNRVIKEGYARVTTPQALYGDYIMYSMATI